MSISVDIIYEKTVVEYSNTLSQHILMKQEADRCKHPIFIPYLRLYFICYGGSTFNTDVCVSAPALAPVPETGDIDSLH